MPFVRNGLEYNLWNEGGGIEDKFRFIGFEIYRSCIQDSCLFANSLVDLHPFCKYLYNLILEIILKSEFADTRIDLCLQ